MINFTNPTLRGRKPVSKTYLLSMKLSVILCLFGMMQVSAAVFSQNSKLTLSFENTSIKDVLNNIEKSTEFRFFYNEDFVNLDQKVTIEATDRPMEEVLTDLLKTSQAGFRVLENNLIVIAPNKLMQKKGISGKITDQKTGAPIPGVNIVIKGTTLGTFTDSGGNYSIEIPEKQATLVFSFVGYQSQEILVSDGSSVNINLIEESRNLEEVVVIGYGTRHKKDVTTSISSIDTKDIVNSTVISPELSLQGKTAGVFVESGGSNPNSRPTIRIRGTNTWGVADPLYVIDGVPVTEFGSGAESSTGAGTGSNDAGLASDIRGNMNIMNMVNPNDIESISILKDASAAAIYGVRAANGVVLITTKRGKSGRPKLNVNVKSGIQNIPGKYKMLNTQDYTSLYLETFSNNPDEQANLPSVFKSSSADYLGNSPTYNWTSPMYNKNAKVNDYTVSLSGGSENTTYYISTGYSRTESPIIDNYLERYTMSTNLNTNINKYIRTGVNYRFAYQKALDDTQGSLINNATTPPWQPIYSDSGVNGYAPAVIITSVPSFVSTNLYGPATHINVFGMASCEDNRYTNIRNMGNAYVEIEPLKGLKFKGSVGVDWYNQVRNSYSLFSGNYFSITPTDPSSYGDGHSYGTTSQRDSRNLNLIKEFSINYSKSFGKHNIDLLFNAMDQRYSYDFLGGGSQQITSPSLIYIEEGSEGYSSAGEYKSESALQGYLGRFQYNYKSKYYFDAVIRRDGSSRFASGHKWGTFPSLSAAWRISDESFLQNLKPVVNDLKLRVGWGQMGNQETKSFAYLSTINMNPHTSFGTTPDGYGIFYSGAAAGDFANVDLTWEKTTTTNVGLDGLLFGTLNFTLEYYDKKTSNLIQEATLPASVGVENNPIINVGEMRNRGFEMSAGYQNKIGELEYSINANLTTVKNEVVKLYNGTPMGSTWGGRIEQGHPVNSLWGYKVGGIFQSDEEVTAYKSKTTDVISSSQHPGDMWFKDINGDNYAPGTDSKVNDYDRTYLGKTIPGYYYGLNIGLKYKKFDLTCYFMGVGDVKKINYFKVSSEDMSSRGNNQAVSVNERWTINKPSKTMPRAVYADPASNNRFSDRWIENAAYFRLSNIQLGYTLPNFKTKVFEKARVWISGSNLFTLTKWSGIDPENETYPIPRTTFIGFDMSF
jgi:TonB-dependent starch-binding outer membrane protein SusC